MAAPTRWITLDRKDEFTPVSAGHMERLIAGVPPNANFKRDGFAFPAHQHLFTPVG
jgi:hypothetical protein